MTKKRISGEGLKAYRALTGLDSARNGMVPKGELVMLTPEEAQPLLDEGGILEEVTDATDNGSD